MGRPEAPSGDPGDSPGWEKLRPRQNMSGPGFRFGRTHLIDLEGQGGKILGEPDPKG
jgi:hypothetical protein